MAKQPSGLGEATLKQGGGRGRGVLAAMRHPAQAEGLVMVAVADIADNPDNPVDRVEEEGLTSLVTSVCQVGVVSPLTLTPAAEWVAAHPHHAEQIGGARWVCLAGHRRRAAAVLAELVEVPAVIRADLADNDAIVLHENMNRLALTPLEEAAAYERLVQQNMSQRAIAAACGVSQGQVSKRRKLLTLPDLLKQHITGGTLDVIDALELLEEFGVDRLAAGIAAQHDPAGLLARTTYRSVKFSVSEWAGQDRRVEAEQFAAAEKDAYAAEPTVQVLGDYYFRHDRLTDDAAIEQARADGQLGVHVAPAPMWGKGKDTTPVVTFHRVDPDQEQQPVSAEAARTARDARESKTARKTRQEALRTMASKMPAVKILDEELLRFTLGGGYPESRTKELAWKLATAAGVGPTASDYYTWGKATRDPELELPIRRHLAWILIVATAEQSIRNQEGTYSYGLSLDEVRLYEGMYARAGYTPTEWEQERIAAAYQKALDDEAEGADDEAMGSVPDADSIVSADEDQEDSE